MKARILVADDHPVLREALAGIINRQGDLMCCGTEACAFGVQRTVGLEKADLVLLDFCLDREDGLELIKVLHAHFPSLRILVFSQMDEMIYAERCLRAGARGFISKEQPVPEVLTAIRKVLAGGIYVSDKIAALALNKMTGVKNGGVENLTNRELQVFRLLGNGMSTRAIATEMSLSFKTVESHRENIKRKLGVTDAAHLVHYALECGRTMTRTGENP